MQCLCDHIMVSASPPLLSPSRGLTSDQETFQTINPVVRNWSGASHLVIADQSDASIISSQPIRDCKRVCFWFRFRHFNGTLYQPGWLLCNNLVLVWPKLSVQRLELWARDKQFVTQAGWLGNVTPPLITSQLTQTWPHHCQLTNSSGHHQVGRLSIYSGTSYERRGD